MLKHNYLFFKYSFFFWKGICTAALGDSCNLYINAILLSSFFSEFFIFIKINKNSSNNEL